MKKSTISAKNKAFWALPKEKQRVAIAKDVLKQITEKFYIPRSGDYFETTSLKNRTGKPSEKLDVLFSELKSYGVSCNVCGIGGCFASLINLGDNAKTKSFISDPLYGEYHYISDFKMRPLLRKVFDSRQLSMIESCFEKSSFGDNGRYGDTEKAKDFGRKYKSDRGRMIAIMNNIIKNKGTFIP